MTLESGFMPKFGIVSEYLENASDEDDDDHRRVSALVHESVHGDNLRMLLSRRARGSIPSTNRRDDGQMLNCIYPGRAEFLSSSPSVRHIKQ
jgi:hypothetical protein